MSAETGVHHTQFKVHRFDADATEYALRKLVLPADYNLPLRAFQSLKVSPYDVSLHEGNLVTNGGWNLIMKNLAGSAGTLFSATVGRIGVGDTATAATAADTDLGAAAGSTHRQFKLISSTPTVGSTGAAGLIFAASFGSALGNFHWQEFGVDQGTADATTVAAVFLNHGISDQGTKVSGQTWTATVTITWT